MINATRNQLANIDNKFQGDAKRVLCVCSAGLLRSPSLANVLHERLGFNTRACGTADSFALIALSEALITWADEIVFVDADCKDYMDIETTEEIKFSAAKVITLDIPDTYNFDDLVLLDIMFSQYMVVVDTHHKI